MVLACSPCLGSARAQTSQPCHLLQQLLLPLLQQLEVHSAKTRRSRHLQLVLHLLGQLPVQLLLPVRLVFLAATALAVALRPLKADLMTAQLKMAGAQPLVVCSGLLWLQEQLWRQAPFCLHQQPFKTAQAAMPLFP